MSDERLRRLERKLCSGDESARLPWLQVLYRQGKIPVERERARLLAEAAGFQGRVWTYRIEEYRLARAHAEDLLDLIGGLLHSSYQQVDAWSWISSMGIYRVAYRSDAGLGLAMWRTGMNEALLVLYPDPASYLRAVEIWEAYFSSLEPGAPWHEEDDE